MPSRDVVVVGGGISGLSLAFYCARAGLSVCVLESEARPGGAMHSHRFAGDGENFWIELGAHTCYNSYGNLLEVMEGCGVFERMIPRERVPFRVLVDGEVKSLFGQIGYLELLVSLPSALWRRREGATVAGFYGGILGRRNYDGLFRHFFNAVPSQETDQFPADLLFKSRERRKDVLRSYTMDAGLQTIPDLVSGAEGIEFVGGQRVRGIQDSGEGYTVATEGGAEYEGRTLALATPAPVTAALLAELRPELAQRIGGVDTASVHSVGVIVRGDKIDVEPVAGIVSPNDLFYSVVSRDTVADKRYRGFTFHFKPEVSDANRRLERICEVLAIDPLALEDVATRENLLPALKPGHAGLVASIDALLANDDLLVTGNYFGGVAIEDCVTRSRGEFERLQRLIQQVEDRMP